MGTQSLRAIAHMMLFAAALGWGNAQAQTLLVRVVDWITQAPIEGAEVVVSRGVSLGMGRLPLGMASAITDAKGEASFVNLPGEESFMAHKAGYSSGCMGCPLLEKKEGSARVRYLVPMQEVALIELREELRLAIEGPLSPATSRQSEIVHRFQRAKGNFDREVQRRQSLQLAASGLCRRDERSGMDICPAGAAGRLGPLHMEREEAALRRFCALAGEITQAQLRDGAERAQLQEMREYCATAR